MEENEYRQMYRAAVPRRCLFEKAVLSRHCACSQARRYNLAEREAVACESSPGRTQCETWLTLLRAKATFTLQTRGSNQPLPHAKEIKVQAGGLLGLREHVRDSDENPWQSEARVTDVHALLCAACEQFAGLGNLPFDEIVRAVAHFNGRANRSGRD